MYTYAIFHHRRYDWHQTLTPKRLVSHWYREWQSATYSDRRLNLRPEKRSDY